MQKVYTEIKSIVGNVVTVKAEGIRNGDLALVGDSYASVIKLDKDIVSLQVFAGARGIATIADYLGMRLTERGRSRTRFMVAPAGNPQV